MAFCLYMQNIHVKKLQKVIILGKNNIKKNLRELQGELNVPTRKQKKSSKRLGKQNWPSEPTSKSLGKEKGLKYENLGRRGSRTCRCQGWHSGQRRWVGGTSGG